MNMTKPLCRKCLLSDMDYSDVYENIRHMIDILPEKEKTEKTEYMLRLDKCRQCEELLEGTCQVCGCYAELRAARKTSHCPGKRKAW